MTTEQLKLAVKAQTLLEVFEHSDVGTQLLRQAKECIDKLIEEDKPSGYITTTPAWREINISPAEMNGKIAEYSSYTTLTNNKINCSGPTMDKLKG